jgi:integrase
MGKYKVRVRLADGKWLSKQMDNLKQAKDMEAKYRVDKIKADEFGIHKAPQIDKIWKQYIKWAEANKRSWKSDKGRWEIHIARHVKNKRMNQITPGNVQKMVAQLNESKSTSTRNKGKTLAPATVKQCVVLLGRVYSWATKRKLYHGPNPCTKIELPRFDNRQTDPLKADQIKKLLSILDTDKNQFACRVIKFALFSGRRRGEILGLTFDDIDFDNRLITFRGENTKNKFTQTIPANDGCMSVLEQCKKYRISDFVFPCTTGSYYSSFPRTYYRIMKKAKIKARFHSLRHSFGSWLASSGEVSIYELQNLLGHRDIALTQRYATLFDDALRRSSNVADKVFKERK